MSMRKTGLYLKILAALLSQERLPVAAARAHAPYEQLAALQHIGGGLYKAVAVAADGAYPAALAALGGILIRVEVKEEIDRVRYIGGVAGVDIVHILDDRHGNLLELAAVTKAERLGAGHDYAHVLALIDRDVAPPIYSGGILACVVYAHAHVQAITVVGQERLHAVQQTAHALVLIHTHNRRAVAQFQLLAIHAVAGVGRVADYADVPLNAAREPRIAQRQVAGLEYRVAVQQFAAGLFVVQRPETAAQLRQEYRLDKIVFEN